MAPIVRFLNVFRYDSGLWASLLSVDLFVAFSDFILKGTNWLADNLFLEPKSQEALGDYCRDDECVWRIYCKNHNTKSMFRPRGACLLPMYTSGPRSVCVFCTMHFACTSLCEDAVLTMHTESARWPCGFRRKGLWPLRRRISQTPPPTVPPPRRPTFMAHAETMQTRLQEGEDRTPPWNQKLEEKIQWSRAVAGALAPWSTPLRLVARVLLLELGSLSCSDYIEAAADNISAAVVGDDAVLE